MISLPGGGRQIGLNTSRYVVQGVLGKGRRGMEPVAAGAAGAASICIMRRVGFDWRTTRKDTSRVEWKRWISTGLTPVSGGGSNSSNSSGSSDPHQQLRIEDFLLERSLTHRPLSGNLVRCTIFDSEGNVKVVSGEFKKNELLSKHGLLPRDLRKLDTSQNSLIPSILVRKNSILVNLLHIRALVEADMVILFDTYGSTDSQMQSVFMYDLEGKLRQGSKAMGGLPYEMRALEAILISVVTALDAEMKVHVSMVNNILAQLEDNIDREKLRLLLIQSKKASAFHQKAMLIRDVIEELLETDEDLAGMYLTEKKQGKIRSQDDHSEIEMLLESYYKFCDEIVQTVGNLMSNIRSTEEIANIILDATRNSLMLLELKFSIGTLGLGTGAFIASLYGMNLKNTIEESDFGFWGVSAFATVFAGLVIVYALKNVRRVQHVNMSKSTFTPGGGPQQLKQHLERVAQFEKSMWSSDAVQSSSSSSPPNLQYYLDDARAKIGQAAAVTGYNLGRADAVAAAAKENNTNNYDGGQGQAKVPVKWTRYLRWTKARKAFTTPSSPQQPQRSLLKRIIYGQEEKPGTNLHHHQIDNNRTRLWSWATQAGQTTPHSSSCLPRHHNNNTILQHHNHNNTNNRARLAIHDIPESAGRDRILHFQRRLNQARARHQSLTGDHHHP